jgi:hypothetical protein
MGGKSGNSVPYAEAKINVKPNFAVPGLLKGIQINHRRLG